MPLRPRLALCSMLIGSLHVACGPERSVPQATSRPDASAAPRGPTSAPPPRSGLGAAPASGCDGLAPATCASTAGCILDQITYRELVCRAADDPCEAAVRHADLIGADADPAVDADTTRAAVERCESKKICVATQGVCSCPCALLGRCNCACGGGFLPRCVMRGDADIYKGRPPSHLPSSPLAAWGDALIAVRRAPRATPFEVRPLPDPSLLVGKQRHAIESVLGMARQCTGAATPSAPCRSGDQVFYSLYHLPSGHLGGGPELLVTYDAGHTATRAVVTHTR